MLDYELDPANGQLRTVEFSPNSGSKTLPQDFFNSFWSFLGIEFQQPVRRFRPRGEPFSGEDGIKISRLSSFFPSEVTGGQEVPVIEDEVVLQEGKGRLLFASTHIIPNLEKIFSKPQDFQPQITREQAQEFAKQYVAQGEVTANGSGAPLEAPGNVVKPIQSGISKSEQGISSNTLREQSAKAGNLNVEATRLAVSQVKPFTSGGSISISKAAMDPAAVALVVVTENFSGETKDARLAWQVPMQHPSQGRIKVYVAANGVEFADFAQAGASGACSSCGKIVAVEYAEFHDVQDMQEKIKLNLGTNVWREAKGAACEGEGDSFKIVASTLEDDEKYAYSAAFVDRTGPGLSREQDFRPSVPANVATRSSSKQLFSDGGDGIFGNGGDEPMTPSAASLHRGLIASANFFMEFLNKKGWTDGDTPITAYLSEDAQGPAALADPELGDLFFAANAKGRPNVCLATVGHEYSHGLLWHFLETHHTGSHESDPIQEGLATVLGVLIRSYALRAPLDFNYNGVVDLSSPKAKAFPDTYGGAYFLTKDCGELGAPYCYFDPALKAKRAFNSASFSQIVQQNSTLVGKWFWLLAQPEGQVSSGHNDLPMEAPPEGKNSYSVKGIGPENARKLLLATIARLPKRPSFKDLRTVSVAEAGFLWESQPELVSSVKEAWYAVGVGGKEKAKRHQWPKDGSNNIYPFPETAEATTGLKVQTFDSSGNEDLEIQISEDKDFPEATTQILSTCSERGEAMLGSGEKIRFCMAAYNFKPHQVYYWRVRKKGAVEWETVWGFMTSAPDLRLESPANDDHVHPWAPKLDLQWNSIRGADGGYELGVYPNSKDCQGEPLRVSLSPEEQTDMSTLKASADIPGILADATKVIENAPFGVQLFAKGPGPENHAVRTPCRILWVDYEETAPVIQGPLDGASFSFQQGLRLSWNPVPNAVKYKVSIESSLTKKIETFETQENFYDLNNKKVNGFQWWVQAIGTNGQLGMKSRPASVQTAPLSMLAHSPPAGAVLESGPNIFSVKSSSSSDMDFFFEVKNTCQDMAPLKIGDVVPLSLLQVSLTQGPDGAMGTVLDSKSAGWTAGSGYCWRMLASTTVADNGGHFLVGMTAPQAFSIKAETQAPTAQPPVGGTTSSSQEQSCKLVPSSPPSTSCPGEYAVQFDQFHVTSNLCQSPLQFGVQQYPGDGQHTMYYKIQACKTSGLNVRLDQCQEQEYPYSAFGTGSPIQLDPTSQWAWRVKVRVEGCAQESPYSEWRYLNCDVQWPVCPANSAQVPAM
ncbi:MAG: M4 family metallopeptidase [bacterium]